MLIFRTFFYYRTVFALNSALPGNMAKNRNFIACTAYGTVDNDFRQMRPQRKTSIDHDKILSTIHT